MSVIHRVIIESILLLNFIASDVINSHLKPLHPFRFRNCLKECFAYFLRAFLFLLKKGAKKFFEILGWGLSIKFVTSKSFRLTIWTRVADKLWSFTLKTLKNELLNFPS